MMKLQFLITTHNLLGQVSHGKKWSLPFIQLPDMYKVITYTGNAS